jgi:RNA polymerase sigma-70 factor (ECF subfamily)
MASDVELLSAWQGGDERSGEELFRRRVGEITRFFRNKAPEPDVADLVSQTFLGIVSGRDRFRGETSFRRFAFAVAGNVLREFIRRRYKREREELDFATLCVAGLDPRSPSSIVMRRREAQTFVNALRQVPIEDQTLLELRYFEAMTGREIAEALGVTEGSIRGKLARATDRLRKLVESSMPRTTPGTAPRVGADDLEAWARDVRARLGRERST